VKEGRKEKSLSRKIREYYRSLKQGVKSPISGTPPMGVKGGGSKGPWN